MYVRRIGRGSRRAPHIRPICMHGDFVHAWGMKKCMQAMNWLRTMRWIGLSRRIQANPTNTFICAPHVPQPSSHHVNDVHTRFACLYYQVEVSCGDLGDLQLRGGRYQTSLSCVRLWGPACSSCTMAQVMYEDMHEPTAPVRATDGKRVACCWAPRSTDASARCVRLQPSPRLLKNTPFGWGLLAILAQGTPLQRACCVPPPQPEGGREACCWAQLLLLQHSRSPRRAAKEGREEQTGASAVRFSDPAWRWGLLLSLGLDSPTPWWSTSQEPTAAQEASSVLNN